MDRKHSKFINHVDNAKETISATHINAMGKAINNVETNIVSMAEDDFTSRALFVLEHNNYVNAMFIDDMKNSHKIFKAKSSNIIFDVNENCVKIEQTATVTEGIVQSIFFAATDEAPVTEVFIMADEYVPKGANIDYFVSTDGQNFFPIKLNLSKPISLQNAGQGVFMRAKLRKNRALESPKIFGWAAFYHDALLEKKYGITNIDLSRTSTGADTVGDTILVRDRDQGDKVIGIVEPESSTELYYDSLGRLDYVIERIGDKTIKETMNYGSYLKSDGTYDTVLLSTTKELLNEASTEGEVPEEILNLDFDSPGGDS